jgi:hypothetical protein
MAVGGFSLGEGFHWRDPDIEGTLIVSQPSADPDLWHEYSAGALRSYRKRGVECALDVEAMRSGADTIMFCAVVDDSGQVVAGLRAKALRSAEDSHAVDEWAGQPGQLAVRKMISDRVPFGILETEGGLGYRRRRSESVSYQCFSAQPLLYDGHPRFSVRYVYGGHLDSESLALFWVGGGSHPGDALSQ